MPLSVDIRRAIAMLTKGAAAIAKVPLSMSVEGAESIEPAEEEAKRLVPRYLERAAERLSALHESWLYDRSVQGIGMAEKKTDGARTGTLALKVYVDKKRPKSKVRNLIRKSLSIKEMDEPIVTDVEEIGTLRLQLNTQPDNPARGGCSIFYGGIRKAGTLGCLVRKRGTNAPLYILSNSHVIADDSTGDVGHAIVQPGELDFATPRTIGKLFQSVSFQPDGSPLLNTVDGAIAEAIPGEVSPIIFGLGTPPGPPKTRIVRGMLVKKSGRTTPLGSTGTIEDIDFTTKLLAYKTGMFRFHHQALCTTFTADGDSGAIVLDSQNRTVGLHFLGSESHSVFNPIGFVLNTFQIDIVT